MDPNLYRAAMEGNVDVLNNLTTQLEAQLTPNENTALHVAAQFGNTPCVKAILQNHPLLLCRTNNKGETALHLAAKEGYSDVVRALIESGAGQRAKDMVRMKNEDDNMALHEAVRYRHLGVVKLLLEVDVDFSYPPNKDGETPLYLAVEKELHRFVSKILNTCKSSSPCGPERRTALHAAVTLDDEVSVKMLLEWKPDLSQEADVNGWTPLHYAVHFNFVERARQLLAVDDDICRSSSSSSTSIAYFITSEEDGKNTALHLATSRGNVSIMELLLSHRPDCFEMVNGNGQNIIHIAVENKKDRVIKFLEREHGAYFDILVNQKDNNGNTPLHLLAASARPVPELLLNPRVEKMVFNKKSMTPTEIRRRNIVIGPSKQLSLFQRLQSRLPYLAKFDKRILFGPSGRRNLIRRYKEMKENKEEAYHEELNDLNKIRDTSLIVASLIATVTFAAGFTLPGGYNSDSGPNQGTAVLSAKAAFQAFVITDTIALLLSSFAVFLYFLATAVKDDIYYHRSRRIYVLANLLILYAIGAMMIAFVTGLYCVLPHLSSLAISTCVIGSIFLFIYYITPTCTLLYLFSD